jgi:hypothetical protein
MREHPTTAREVKLSVYHVSSVVLGEEPKQKGNDGVAHHRFGGRFWPKGAKSDCNGEYSTIFPTVKLAIDSNQQDGGTQTLVASITPVELARQSQDGARTCF